MLKIYAHELQNDLILPLNQGGLYSACDNEGKIFIGETSPQKYTPKHMNLTMKIIKITCIYKTCISSMLHRYEWNKRGLIQMSKFEKLFHNTKPTSLEKK